MQYKNKEWLETQFITNKLSFREIAKICNTTHKTISDWCKKFGLESNYYRKLNESTWELIKRKHNGRTSSNGCWEHNMKKDNQGYGQIEIKGINRKLHIVIYEEEERKLLPKEQCNHKCHNRGCCNPSHILPGTHLENMYQMVDQNILTKQELNNLSNDKKLEILRKFHTKLYISELSYEYNLSIPTIEKIINMKWEEV